MMILPFHPSMLRKALLPVYPKLRALSVVYVPVFLQLTSSSGYTMFAATYESNRLAPFCASASEEFDSAFGLITI
jgi:hypothetical protein